MANLNDVNTESLIEFLSQTKLTKSDIEKILKDNSLEYAEYEKAFFLMHCYAKHSVIQPMKQGWLKRTIDTYQENPITEEGGILELWDESYAEEYSNSLDKLFKLGANEKDLYRIIKETQKNVLANLMETLDGTFGSEFGLFETEFKDDNFIPSRRIMGLQDVFLEFDPRNDEE